jgi:DNA-binding NtrC family response regulator
VLQEHEFTRVGGTRPIRTDVRIIAATNRNLQEAVSAGTFRNDLLQRLNVVAISLPPLRERRDDIGLLANYFVARLSRKCGRTISGVTPNAKAAIMRYSWPGNVRELENAIERAIVLGEDEEIHLHDLPETIWETASATDETVDLTTYEHAISEFKRRLVTQAMRDTGGNVSEAARRLGVHVTYLNRLIRTFDLRTDVRKFRAQAGDSEH